MDGESDSATTRARRTYEERVRPLVDPGEHGKVVAVDVRTGDFEIARTESDRIAAVHRLRARQPDPEVFSFRVGFPAVARIGGFRRHSDETDQA